MNDPEIIYGPPGTGKTTKLLAVVDDALGCGLSPADICFVAFTRKAANEAKTRAMEKFNLLPEQLPWFSTLHSLAFRKLGCNRANVMGIYDYLALAKELSISLTFNAIGEDGTIACLSRGDKLIFMENMARARGMPLKELWESLPNEDIYWHELERLEATLNRYKKNRGKMDYTDIIVQFCEAEDLDTHYRLVIVDEAQDLSPIQWRMAKKIITSSDRAFIAGDDDQAIFRWAGADVDHIINLPGNRTILPQSYRVPSAIQEVAEKIISQVGVRVTKSWAPRPDIGEVIYANGLQDIDMAEGTWLLLGRNVYILDQYIQHCMQEGFLFETNGKSPIELSTIRAIKTWESMRKGDYITAGDIKECYDLMTTKVGVAYGSKKKLDALPDKAELTVHLLAEGYGLLKTTVWHDALDKIPLNQREYFISALKRGEKMRKTPRIKISTIHGAKGGEADNVVICPDMAIRTFNEMQENPDDEHRVWYVAVTRAKQRLFIMQPQTVRYYPV